MWFGGLAPVSVRQVDGVEGKRHRAHVRALAGYMAVEGERRAAAHRAAGQDIYHSEVAPQPCPLLPSFGLKCAGSCCITRGVLTDCHCLNVPVNRWLRRFPADRVFVDEFSCIGCRNCNNVCPKTFAMEEEYGRARVMVQDADTEAKLQVGCLVHKRGRVGYIWCGGVGKDVVGWGGILPSYGQKPQRGVVCRWVG